MAIVIIVAALLLRDEGGRRRWGGDPVLLPTWSEANVDSWIGGKLDPRVPGPVGMAVSRACSV